MILDFLCSYSKDSIKKALVTQVMTPIIINTPMDRLPLYIMSYPSFFEVTSQGGIYGTCLYMKNI